MKTKPAAMRLVSVGLALWFGMIACSFFNTTRVGALKSETQAVDLGSADTARVRVDFPAGELLIEDGSSSLLDASFRYNVSDWQPEVKYSENGAQGDLSVSVRDNVSLPVGGNLINEWSLQFASGVPIDLSLHTGAGNAELDLGDLDLMALNIETGAGVTVVRLDGAWQHDLAVSIKSGVGEMTIHLPSEMGVRVEMETALVSVTADGLRKDGSSYVNDAFGIAPHTLTLKLEAGVGSIELVTP